MLTMLMAAALAANTPVVAEPKLDPAKDQVAVCTLMIAEKLQAVNAGGDPVSIAVPLYTDRAKMSEKEAAEFAHGCELFERGFVLGVQVKATSQPTSQPVEEEDEGTAPDHRDEPVAYRR